MNILCLNFGRDESLCVLKNWRLVAAINTERISKIKRNYAVTVEVIQDVSRSKINLIMNHASYGSYSLMR